MNQVELAPGIYHLQSGSNAGLVVRDGRGLLIDAGLDKDAARRIQRAVEGLGVTLEAAFITHAHADHFGGVHRLQERMDLPVYGPAVEASMMESPIIEPLYLFGGAAPIQELRGKFTLAPPCRVDHVVGPGPLEIGPFQVEVVLLEGHAPHQLGLGVGDVLFCADAVFPTDTLEKHKVIFTVDLDRALATLERLPDLSYAHFAPGHGPAYAAGQEIEIICTANRARLEEIRALVHAAVGEGQETPALVKHVGDHFGLQLRTPTAYFLTRTTVLAALSSLEGTGDVGVRMDENRLLWHRA